MPCISAEMIARSHSVGEPRWSPTGRLIGWLDSWDSRTDLMIAPSDGSSPPSVVSADFAVTSAGAYGGGGWCWITDDELAVGGADGSLAVIRADGGGVVRVVCSTGSTFAPSAAPDGSAVAFCWERDETCDVMVAHLDGALQPIQLSHADYAWDPAWSPDGHTVVWHEWDIARMSWQGSRIGSANSDGTGGVSVLAGQQGAVAVGQPRFSPDGRHLAWISDESGWWNVVVALADGSDAHALRIEPNDHASPSWGPGQRTFAWSPDGSAIAYERNEEGFGRLVVATVDGTAVRDIAKAFHGGLDWSANGIIATRSGAKTPQQIVVYNIDAGSRRTVARGPVAGFEACGLVEPEMVSWDSQGHAVQGVLRRPAGIEAPPMLVSIHGGPTDQAVAVWNPRAAYWVSRGWAVLQVNYRGSSGYGRKYRDALEGQWGIADVADVAAGIRHAGASAWCDSGRVVVTGGSAGGFTTLLVCALHGDLVRAGVSLFGVGDLFDLAATTHRFESTYLDGLVGVLPADADRYRDRSPIRYAHRINVPMLMLQGRDDKVVPVAQSDAMVEAMRAGGAHVDYQIYDGEGHGFRKLGNVIDEYLRTEAFLQRWVLDA